MLLLAFVAAVSAFLPPLGPGIKQASFVVPDAAEAMAPLQQLGWFLAVSAEVNASNTKNYRLWGEPREVDFAFVGNVLMRFAPGGGVDTTTLGFYEPVFDESKGKMRSGIYFDQLMSTTGGVNTGALSHLSWGIFGTEEEFLASKASVEAAGFTEAYYCEIYGSLAALFGVAEMRGGYWFNEPYFRLVKTSRTRTRTW
jgi:hypothetical protein